MAREKNLQIRLTVEERARVKRIAKARDLADSTWARTIVLREVRRIEAQEARTGVASLAQSTSDGDVESHSRSGLRRVAEPGAPPPRKRRP